MKLVIERLIVKLFWNIAPIRKAIQRVYPPLRLVLTLDEFAEIYIRPHVRAELDDFERTYVYFGSKLFSPPQDIADAYRKGLQEP